jgi:SAM-dependent methyltransferase
MTEFGALGSGLGLTCSYKCASFDATGLDPTSFDGAFSVDVIWAIPDKRAGFAATVRILKPDARFVFTDWNVTSPLRATAL